MLIKLISSRPKLNEDGTAKLTGFGKKIIVFKYTVHGTKEDLARYKNIQGEDHYREDENGTPLYFSTRGYGLTAKLEISINDKLYVDTTNMDMAQSLIENYGEVGRIMAMDLLGKAGATAVKTAIEIAKPLDE